jgi:hypothetical protein
MRKIDSHNGQTLELPSVLKGTLSFSFTQLGHSINPLTKLVTNYNI